jgi:hypothetical protein
MAFELKEAIRRGALCKQQTLDFCNVFILVCMYLSPSCHTKKLAPALVKSALLIHYASSFL